MNTLFCQHVAGYVGRDASHRGADVATEARWSLTQLQELLEEWVIAGWQTRPHDGLVGPDTGRTLSPNEMYATLVAAAGYVPVMLTGTDYIELLPATWRTINDYGVRIDRRTYDAKALNPLRCQHSGVNAQNGKWKVRFDPYDLSQIWIRDHRGEDGGFIRAVWTRLPMVLAPFAHFTWRRARELTTSTGEPVDETAIARTLDDLLGRAGAGPVAEKGAGSPRGPVRRSKPGRHSSCPRSRTTASTTNTTTRMTVGTRWSRSGCSTRTRRLGDGGDPRGRAPNARGYPPARSSLATTSPICSRILRSAGRSSASSFSRSSGSLKWELSLARSMLRAVEMIDWMVAW